jgi:hypothetical protein
VSDIFISYAREDKSRVSAFADELTRLGWTVWYDSNLAAAEEFDERIERELETASCVIVVWSRASVRSRWVKAEAGSADDQGKLIPITFDADVIPPTRFRNINVVKLPSVSLANPTGPTLSLLNELSATTGRRYRGAPPNAPIPQRASGRSGARTVTPGKWTIATRLLLATAKYDLDLLSSGMVTGTAAWTISRARLSGRWHYDHSMQLLHLELTGGVSKGIEAISVRIVAWESDDTATCQFLSNNQTRRATLTRTLA